MIKKASGQWQGTPYEKAVERIEKERILAMFEKGVKQKEIAFRMGMSESTVNRIKHGQR